MTWQIWFAVAAIVLTIVGLVKRLETRMLLVVAGFCMCAVAGEPLKAFQSFVKGMTNPTLVPAICSAMGFAAAVTASKCDCASRYASVSSCFSSGLYRALACQIKEARS